MASRTPSGEKVVSLTGAPVTEDRREAFLAAVGLSYDLYVKSEGAEPDAIVYVLNGLRKSSRLGWHTSGESQGGSTAIIALAAIHIMAEAQNSG